MIPRFRVWDAFNRTMYLPSNYGTQFVMGQGGTVYVQDGMGLSELKLPVRVMLSTDLQDKNGVEVFEGDILRDSTKGPLVQVRFGEYTNGEKYEDYNSGLGFFIFGGFYVTRRHPHRFFILERCEVIGNIYENEALLAGP